jgi:branched-chain amino acid transport system ATP-binding protein
VSETILSVRNLSVRYGKVEALHAVNLEVRSGTIVTVIGPNGAGKSSMLGAIMGTLPFNGRSSGEIVYDSNSVGDCGAEQRVVAGMSLVPEKRELFTTMTVEDNLLLGGYPRFRSGDKQYAGEMERIYGIFPRLKERRKQEAGTLSGGERQMLAVGRALMARPKLLMLDEPSLGLAPLIVKEMLRAVAQLRQTGVAILLVEQNARAALQIADYGYVLETGDLVIEGDSARLARNPRVIESYLGFSRKAHCGATAVEEYGASVKASALKGPLSLLEGDRGEENPLSPRNDGVDGG